MLKKIEYLIPAALQAIDTHLLPENSDSIPSGYQGALAGFGTSLLQMGLLPTLAVYLDKENDADIGRDVLLETLLAVLRHPDSRLSAGGKQMAAIDTVLRDLSGADNAQRKEFSHHLMQAALALKLAIRTYKLT